MALIDNDPRKETDICHTPFESKRRETMRVRSQGYGFFKVVKQPTVDPKCAVCMKSPPLNHMIINGMHYHNECFNGLCQDK